ncbi:MAG: prephenate dehydrogenase [Actinomycetia bacterium]|nr:prephenate dehydrogenase [Actinomycetes bacterium]
MTYRIGIVGLGLMGGSLAFALRGFKDAQIVGTNRHPEVCQRALTSGAVDEASTDPALAIQGSDLVIFCIYGQQIPSIIAKHRDLFKPGAVLSDINGVKSGLYQQLAGQLPEQVDYVGLHPMAGKERDGFDQADAAIFKNSGLIIVPWPSTRPESIELASELAHYIGVTRLSITPPAEHDAIIAYTSDLMHISAASLCLDFHPGMNSAFTAGAFRDCTRIADINAAAWTELLLANRPNTLDRLERYIASLEQVRACLTNADAAGWRALLQQAGDNKREMLKR